MFLLILYFNNLIDTLLRIIFHVSNISLTNISNPSCKINKIKGMKPHNSAQSSWDTQDNTTQDAQLSSTSIQVFFHISAARQLKYKTWLVT